MATNAYTSAAKVKTYLRLSDARDDAEFDEVSGDASRFVDSHCARRFWLDTNPSTRYYVASDDLVMVDDISTVASITQITEDGTVVDLSNVQFEPLNQVSDNGNPGWPIESIRRLDRVWKVTGKKAIIGITATFGWATVPSNVSRASLILAADLYHLSKNQFGVAGFGDYGAVRIRKNMHVSMLLEDFILPTGFGG